MYLCMRTQYVYLYTQLWVRIVPGKVVHCVCIWERTSPWTHVSDDDDADLLFCTRIKIVVHLRMSNAFAYAYVLVYVYVDVFVFVSVDTRVCAVA